MLGLSRKLPSLNLDFIGMRKIAYAFSGLLMLFSLLGFLFFGLNQGIDFHGGTLVELGFKDPVSLNTIRPKVNHVSAGATLQTFGTENHVLLRVSQTFEKPEERALFVRNITQALAQEAPSVRRIESIGPKVGSEAVMNALFATMMALLFMLIYVWIRFEWHYGLCAILALIHDSLGVFALYSLARVEFNFTSIVAILITIGYSINDTVVIYDRIRDQAHLDMGVPSLINRSINISLSRTLLTSLSTLVSLLALYFYGGPVIATYSLPIIIGVVVGTYSSIFIAAPLLHSMNAPIKLPPKQDVTKLPEQYEL